MFNKLKIEGTCVGVMGNEAIKVGRAELLKTLSGLQRSTDFIVKGMWHLKYFYQYDDAI